MSNTPHLPTNYQELKQGLKRMFDVLKTQYGSDIPAIDLALNNHTYYLCKSYIDDWVKRCHISERKGEQYKIWLQLYNCKLRENLKK